MSIPSKQRRTATLRNLRKLMDSTSDPCEFRIAYAMEIAIVWATNETEGWLSMAVEAKQLAKLLRDEMPK